MAWGVAGWLVMTYIQRIGPAALAGLKARVANELKSTFASKCSREISLAETLSLPVIAAFRQRATGQKYLINPNKQSVQPDPDRDRKTGH
jgi:NADPH2:quinone reductase